MLACKTFLSSFAGLVAHISVNLCMDCRSNACPHLRGQPKACINLHCPFTRITELPHSLLYLLSQILYNVCKFSCTRASAAASIGMGLLPALRPACAA